MFRMMMAAERSVDGQQGKQQEERGEDSVVGEEEEEPLWLGLDLSTQSLTAAVLKGDGVGGAFNEPVVLESVNFEVSMCRSNLISSGDHPHHHLHEVAVCCTYWYRAIPSTTSSSQVYCLLHEYTSVAPLRLLAQQCPLNSNSSSAAVLHNDTL